MTTAIETSPKLYARIAGFLYLIIIVIGLFGEGFVRERLIVSRDAAATAANISSHESRWRFHITAELFLLLCAVWLTLILFILKRLSHELALLAIFFNLVSITVEAASAMYLIQVVFPLGKSAYLKAFTPQQLYALAYLSVKPHGYGFGVAVIFFGAYYLVAGYLIFRWGNFKYFKGHAADAQEAERALTSQVEGGALCLQFWLFMFAAES